MMLRRAYYAFEKLSTKVDPLLYEFMEVCLTSLMRNLLNRLHHHLEYLYSAFFSKRVFEIENDPKS